MAETETERKKQGEKKRGGEQTETQRQEEPVLQVHTLRGALILLMAFLFRERGALDPAP